MDEPERIQKHLGNRLLQWGMVLFFLGLLTGLALPAMANPRMGLSSHLEGVMNGMFLILLGLMWHKLKLSTKSLRIGFWLVLYGTYVNWATILIAGFVGAGEKMLPIAGAGHRGSDLQELLIRISLVSLVLAILAASVIVLWGLRGIAKTEGAR